MNDAIISLNWGIGKRLSVELTGNNKPEYGKKVVAEVSKRLEQEYGSGFDKTSISRMIKFYQCRTRALHGRAEQYLKRCE